MTSLIRLTAAAAAAALAFGAAACTPADNDTADGDTDTTIVETREVPANPVVVEREVAVPSPPVVIEDRREGDSTTVRAGEKGIEVETTNR